MKASVSYQELQKLVTEQTKQPISFEFVDQKTIKVLYPADVPQPQDTLSLGYRSWETGRHCRLLCNHELKHKEQKNKGGHQYDTLPYCMFIKLLLIT